MSERPRSPCTAPAIQVRYWARKGRSIPSSWRARASVSGVGAAAWSSCMMTASPGRMRTREKISRETSQSTRPPCSSRRAMYVLTRGPDSYCANLSNFRAGAAVVIHVVFASYEQ